ncbi:MAG: hypothetical protein ACQ9ET_00205 [Nitrosomonadaceae bacterium]
MKKLSSDDLSKRAQAYMKEAGVDVVYMTTDGNIFLASKKHFADAHAKSQKLDVVEIKKKAEETPKAKSKSNSKNKD